MGRVARGCNFLRDASNPLVLRSEGNSAKEHADVAALNSESLTTEQKEERRPSGLWSLYIPGGKLRNYIR